MVEIYGMKPTRFGYGEALVALGEKNPRIIALAADTAASVYVHLFQKQFPDRFVQMGVAEQNMMGAAAGLAIAGWVPFATTYGMFASGRPWEMIRNTIAYSNLNVKIGGSHGGISVGPDGATHQALEEIAIMRVIPRMTVVVPCDMNETRKATMALGEMDGPAYIRFGREPAPVITKEDSPFKLGRAEVLRKGNDVALLACGAMVYESLAAAELLEKRGISARVVNIHTIKPIDENAVIAAARECGAIVTAEEHQVTGGFGSAVAEVLVKHAPAPVEMVGIFDRFGESGSPAELYKAFKLKDADIAAAAEKVLARKRARK
jgi:transketolase